VIVLQFSGLVLHFDDAVLYRVLRPLTTNNEVGSQPAEHVYTNGWYRIPHARISQDRVVAVENQIRQALR